MKKILVAVTGASGAIYARQTIDLLTRIGELEEIGVMVSRHGREVLAFEGEQLPARDPRIRFFDNDDLFAPPASGSADYDAMIVVPCSMGSVGRMAAGVSSDLIGRAADVMLKGTRVDGIYTADPEKDPTAVKYDELTFDKALEDHLKVMDQTAFALCREGNMPIIVFDMNRKGNLEKLIKGEKIGTLVHV